MGEFSNLPPSGHYVTCPIGSCVSLHFAQAGLSFLGHNCTMTWPQESPTELCWKCKLVDFKVNLIQPCQCRGSRGYVHATCFAKAVIATTEKNCRRCHSNYDSYFIERYVTFWLWSRSLSLFYPVLIAATVATLFLFYATLTTVLLYYTQPDGFILNLLKTLFLSTNFLIVVALTGGVGYVLIEAIKRYTRFRRRLLMADRSPLNYLPQDIELD